MAGWHVKIENVSMFSIIFSIIDLIHCPQYLSNPPERPSEQLELPIQSILTFAPEPIMPASLD